MMTWFDPPRRLCSNCHHWGSVHTGSDAYVVAYCTEPPDHRDRELKRGSDRCSKWSAIKPPEPTYDEFLG